jgi:hypothetical protein
VIKVIKDLLIKFYLVEIWKIKADKVFVSLFPTIHNFIKLYKKEKGDYRVLAYDLKAEVKPYIQYYNKKNNEYILKLK